MKAQCGNITVYRYICRFATSPKLPRKARILTTDAVKDAVKVFTFSWP